MRRYLLAVLTAVFIAVGIAAPAYALDPPSKPTDIPVVDQTNTLTEPQKEAMADKIAAERKLSNNQIAVLMIPSLEGDALEDYSIRTARDWGIGGKERDSGVLLLVVKNERKVRIEVGYGLEGALTDARSSRIIRNQIAPAFRNNDFNGGIIAGLDGIIGAINGEKDSSGSAARSENNGVPWDFIFVAVLIVPAWLASILGRTKSWWAGGVIGGAIGVGLGFFFGWLFVGVAAIIGLAGIGLLFDYFVSRNFQQNAKGGHTPSWWAGGPWIGGGSNGGSGGFGGFGGGGFGGGGSSGSW